MERLKYPLNHEWHAAVNRHSDERLAAGNAWRKTRFMYDAKTMTGVGREWVEKVLRVSRADCLQNARKALAG